MNYNKGFTLIELLVSLAVFALMVSFAAPNLADFSKRNRLSSHTNIFVAHLNMARSEAVKRNKDIKLCISNAAFSTCNYAGATSSEPWEEGWIAFIDTNNDNNFATGDGDILIKVGEAISGGNTIRSTQYFDIITYKKDGSVNAAGTFKVCDEDGTLATAKTINISSAGHISIGADTDSDKIPNDYTNTEITSCT